jgi:hypothetical protein
VASLAVESHMASFTDDLEESLALDRPTVSFASVLFVTA